MRLRWKKGTRQEQGLKFLSIEKEKENHQLGTQYFLYHRISAVKRVEFVRDRMSHTVLRGRWCNIIVLNVHAASEEICDDSKDGSYEELEQVFDHFRKYNMNILLWDFNATLRRKGIF